MPILQSRLLVIPPEMAPVLLSLVEAGHKSLRTTLPQPVLQVIAELRDLAGDVEPARVWLTTAGAARQLGVSVRRVVQMANTGELTAERRGGRWLVDANDVDARVASACYRFVDPDNVDLVHSSA